MTDQGLLVDVFCFRQQKITTVISSFPSPLSLSLSLRVSSLLSRGALIGSRVNYTSADDDCGGDLVYRVLQLMRLTANRLTLSASTTSPTNLTTSSAGASRLEMASLSFFEQFRRIYASESVGRMARVSVAFCLLSSLFFLFLS